MSLIRALNLGVRFLLELCALGALAYWGFRTGASPSSRLGLTVGAPLLAAVVWGTVIAPKAAMVVPAAVRLAFELVIFGLAIAGLADAGRPLLAGVLATAYLVNRILLAAGRQEG